MPGFREPRRPLGPRASPPKLWTLEAANDRLEELREVLASLRAWAGRLADVRAELDRLVRFWGEELEARDQPDHGLSGRLEVERRNLARRLRESVDALSAEGIELRQLESGLVDFYAILDGEPVFWCWHMDEPTVAFYHSLREGFAGRRPLPFLRRSIPTDPGGPP